MVGVEDTFTEYMSDLVDGKQLHIVYIGLDHRDLVILKGGKCRPWNQTP
jgi:hypothetical protein